MLTKFTDIPDRLKYPPNVKGVLSSYHSSIVLYAAQNFVSTKKFRRQVINTMNTITYHVVNSNELPAGWSESAPLLNEDLLIDEFECKDALGVLFLDESDIDWDVDEIYDPVRHAATVEALTELHTGKSTQPTRSNMVADPSRPVYSVPAESRVARITNIEDLSIQPPLFPQVDFSKPWFKGSHMGVEYAIYPSLPVIPGKQREISITTDVNIIPESALLSLYPCEVMQTRGSDMYQPVEGLDFSEELGVILEISNFHKKDIIDNIVKYPHLYNIRRTVDGRSIPFHKMIEIDGQLFNTGEVWDTLPDTANLPKSTPFVKEYVIRRYLLERDILGVDHTSKIFGDLSPFLTLFLPTEMYAKFGYTDFVEVARSCVTSRVAYKQTRSPVLRRFTDE